MNVRWLSWINISLFVSVLIFLGLGSFFYIRLQNKEVICSTAKESQCGLPKNSFELPSGAYENLGETILVLQHSPPTMQLPDLKNSLVYYGKNGRPDVNQEKPILHFAFSANNKEAVSTPPQTPLYLIFDRSGGASKYTFSPNNEKTSLWIVAKPEGNEAIIDVIMENEAGERVLEPEAFVTFKLSEKEYGRHNGFSFDIGGQRADGSLLSKQKAKWFGGDRFLEQHGGDDFKNITGKQRVDFGDGDELYSIFVAVNDTFIWDGKRWQPVQCGEASLNQPLLILKKIEERLLGFELWDKEGKSKTSVNLLKSAEPPSNQSMQSLQTAFKFVGARTLKQCVFEINGERVILSPSDWLLLTPKGWKKISTEDDIDRYVQRKLTGALFVFSGVSRKDEKQVMKGTLFTPSRNDSQLVEIPLQIGGGVRAAVKEVKDDDDDDDEITDATRRRPMQNKNSEHTRPPGNPQKS